jgi:hypothetical protein
MRISALLTTSLALAVFVFAVPARADVSSWYSVAPGVSVISDNDFKATPMIDLDIGIGTPSTNPLVVGALFHFAPQFTVGADLGGALRLASGGYVSGRYGFALDLGSHYRFATLGGAAGSARVIFGIPWGVFFGLGGSYGENDVTTASATIGFDFARATVHRSYGEEFLPSPLHQP